MSRRESAVDLSTRLGPLLLKSPVLTAAGTSGHGAELSAYVDLSGLGAVVVKSLYKAPWPGNPPPRVHGGPFGMLNSVGLQGPGVGAWLEQDLPGLVASGAQVIASVWGRSVKDYASVAEALSDAPPEVIGVEVNVSCPNVEDREKMFAHSPSATADAVAAVARCKRPMFAKLSPNAPDLVAIAEAAIGAGASGVTLVNTALGLAIDPRTRRPLLGGIGGGLSGGALFPIALRAVYDVRRCLPTVPIIGVGGVARASDALELIYAGANAIEVGTATLVDPRAPARVAAGIASFLEREGVKGIDELIGAAHR